MVSKKKDPNYTVATPSWITYLILIGSWVQFQDWKKKTKNQIPRADPKDHFNLDPDWIAEWISSYLKWTRNCTATGVLPHIRYMATKPCDLLWCRTTDPQRMQNQYTYTKAGENLVFELTGRIGELAKLLLDKQNKPVWMGLVALAAFRLSSHDGERESKPKGLDPAIVQSLCAMTPIQFQRGIEDLNTGFTVVEKGKEILIQGEVTLDTGKYKIDRDLVCHGEKESQDDIDRLNFLQPPTNTKSAAAPDPPKVSTKKDLPKPAFLVLHQLMSILGFSKEDIALCQTPGLLNQVKTTIQTWVAVRKEEQAAREQQIQNLEEKKKQMAQKLATLEAQLQKARQD